MLEMQFTPATIILLALIIVGVFFAVRRMVKKGLCDCHDDDCDCCSSKKAKKGACPSCSAVNDMVSNMDKAVKHDH